MEERDAIRIVLVSGSARPNNYTLMALRMTEDELKRQGVETWLIDPPAQELPMPGMHPEAPDLEQLRSIVESADGVILATPLYNGSYSSVIKLVIDNLGYPSALTGKAVSLLGVAASPFGAQAAIDHLHDVCIHIQANVLPDPVSIASVWEAFSPSGECLDPEVETRLRALATSLVHFITSFVQPMTALNDSEQI